VIDVILVLIAGFQVIDYSSVPRELPHPTSTAFGFNAPAWSCPHTPDPGGGSVTDHHRPQTTKRSFCVHKYAEMVGIHNHLCRRVQKEEEEEEGEEEGRLFCDKRKYNGATRAWVSRTHSGR
jgi:hypothetical protein